MKKFALFLAIAAVLVFSGIAQAVLKVRGLGTIVSGGAGSGGQYLLIYDTELDITWLDFTKLPHIWNVQIAWAEDLLVEINGQTYDNWRLPHIMPVNGLTYDYNRADDGSTDFGFNMSAPGSAYPGSIGSEMAHLYYYSLGNLSPSYPDGTPGQPGYGLLNTGPFENLQARDYWSSTVYSPIPGNVWDFDLGSGWQGYDGSNGPHYVIAVRDGDVMPLVEYGLIGREYFPGIIIGATTFGAMFAGKVVNDEGIVVGHFNVSTDHQDGPIEACKAFNTLVRFRLTIWFFDGRRLVMVMPHGETAKANWIWDDVDCPDGGRGCEIHSIDNIELGNCEDVGDPNVSLIAEVGTITLNKRPFGSRGFVEISGGIVYGWLIHTPPIFPAVIGTFVGN